MTRNDNYKRIIDESISDNAKSLDEIHDAIADHIDTHLAANAADISQLTGEVSGRIDNMADESDRAMYKPLQKIADDVDNTISRNNGDLQSVGYQPHFYQSDVQAALNNPNQMEVLANALAPICLDGRIVDGVCVGPIVPIPIIPPVPISPPPVNPPPTDTCGTVCAVQNDGSTICYKDPDCSPISPPPGPPTPPPPPPPPPPEGCCPAPDIIIPPQAPPVVNVTVMPPPPPPTQPPQCSPSDPNYPDCEPPPPDLVCDPTIENIINFPPIKFPDPAVPPKFKFATLAADPVGTGAIEWDKDDGCNVAKDLCDKWNQVVNATEGTLQDVADVLSVPFGKWISNNLGVSQTSGGVITNLAFSLMNDLPTDTQDATTVRVTAAAFSQVRLLYRQVKENFGESAACAMAPLTARSAYVAMTKDIGFNAEYITTPLQYEYQYINPVYIPDQPEIDALWLGDRLSDEQHECYTRANGNLPHLHRMVAEEKRERLRLDEWIDLWRRGAVDWDRVIREGRKLGWLEQDMIVRRADLTEAIPPFSDIIRMMIRDVQNPSAIAQGNLGAGFENNFNGQLAQWANAQGITEDIAKKYWYAHWQWPSNTALFEMLHRLRPGEVDDDVVTTADTVQKAIEINDMAPAFVKRLIEISYRPLTRVDVRRAYEIGVLTKDDVYKAYLDLGYNTKNAQTLADYTELDIRRKAERKSHVWSLSSIATSYIDGSIDRSFAFAKARLLLDSDEQAQQFIADVDAKRAAKTRSVCLKSLKKRYMLGELSEDQVSDEVYNYVEDRDASRDIVDAWTCEKKSRRKEVAAGTLCKWIYQGILTQDQYFTRLINLGYTTDDAVRMLASCGQDVVEKLKAKAVKEAKDALTRIKAQIDQAVAKLKDTQKKYDALCQKAQLLDPTFKC